jgi:RNA polymerase sigma-70 factor (ECF subfamily)
VVVHVVDESRLLAALRSGDEAAFAELVDRYHASLKRFARTFGASDVVAEEIVQETWLGALQGLDRFEQRSSLKTWLFTILKNQARHRAAREKRSVPFSALDHGDDDDGPVIDPDRFQAGDRCWPDHWSAAPRPWEEPEQRLAALDVREQIRRALAELPRRHQLVVVLRDIEGLDADEVCDILEISESNQRVLLHRGRSAIRTALEEYIDG